MHNVLSLDQFYVATQCVCHDQELYDNVMWSKIFSVKLNSVTDFKVDNVKFSLEKKANLCFNFHVLIY